MREMLDVTNALADANRVRLLAACRKGERCVCQLIELLGLAPSTVSKHLTILKQAGLLESRKDGRWMHYRLATDTSKAARLALNWVLRLLDGDPRIHADDRALRRILNTDPTVLCLRQRVGAAGCCEPRSRSPEGSSALARVRAAERN